MFFRLGTAKTNFSLGRYIIIMPKIAEILISRLTPEI